MTDRETCRTCGRPMIARPGDLEATCGECHSTPDACDCGPLGADAGDPAGVVVPGDPRPASRGPSWATPAA